MLHRVVLILAYRVSLTELVVGVVLVSLAYKVRSIGPRLKLGSISSRAEDASLQKHTGEHPSGFPF